MSTVTDPVADGTFEPSTDPVAAPVGRVHLRPRGWFARAILGREGQPGWAHPALLVLLAATAVLYLWNLTASGYANDFYAAAVKAGTQSLKAWLFGSLDAGNSITVDKPPAFLWVTVAFARVFGFSSFSLLAPQALMGVGTVALVHAAVRRISGPVAGLLAGTAVAATPVAALMFRFDNPDALLTLLLALACYATLRAVQGGRRGGLGFLVLAGVAVGLAFLTKMGEALLFLPGLGLAYLVAAQPRLLLRLRNLLIAGAAVVVSAAWYVALVDLWPAASRPYIGGSTDNSLLQLALGYNGFGRLTGGDGNPGGGGFGGGGAGPGFGGATGLLRMFSTEFAGEIAWLLPTALFALAVGLVFTRRRPRTDRTRAALIAWGGCLLVSTVVFSYMSGIIHPYYTVVLAPPIAALIATTGRVLWLQRGGIGARCLLAVMIAGTSLWGVRLISSLAPGWFGRPASVATIAASLGAAAVLLVPPRAWRRAALTTTAVAVAVGLIAAGTPGAAFAVATVANAHGGAVPASGPAGAAGTRPRGFPELGDRGRGGDVPDRAGDDGLPGAPGEAPVGPPGLPGEFPGGPGEFPGGSGGLPGGPGGLGEPMGVDNAVIALLNATSSTWSAAVIGSQSAAAYELSTDTAVMAIGGFSGSDPSPTLAQFQQYVREGRIAYFIVGGGFGGFGRLGGGFGPGGGPQGTQRVSSQITAWVQQNFTATTVGNVTVYRLTAG